MTLKSRAAVFLIAAFAAVSAQARQQVLVLDPQASKVRFTLKATGHEVEGGLALTSGDTKSVGVGGLTLGGGMGWMIPKHGLTIDALRAVDLVTADGTELRASAGEHPDTEYAHRRALDERRAGTPRQRQTSNRKADSVVCGVREEVERVGLKRAGPGDDAAANLDREHHKVDRERHPKDAAPLVQAAKGVNHLVRRRSREKQSRKNDYRKKKSLREDQ